MNRPPLTRGELSALCDEIGRLLANSRADLDRALRVAWALGRVLRVERDRVRRTMGCRAWPEWLRVTFRGDAAMARRYLRLAEETTSPDALLGFSLRQAYFRLGVSTEPKLRVGTSQRNGVTGYMRNSQRLLIELRRRRRRATMPEFRRVRADLAPLFEELRQLFDRDEAQPATP